MAAKWPDALSEVARAVLRVALHCLGLVVCDPTTRPVCCVRNVSCSFSKSQGPSRAVPYMPKDGQNPAQSSEGRSGGRSTVAGQDTTRQRIPKRSLRVHGSISSPTPLSKRPSTRSKGEAVRCVPPEESLVAEAELKAEGVRQKLQGSWQDSSAAWRPAVTILRYHGKRRSVE